MKPITALPHGILDYAVGVLLITAPWLFGFHDLSNMATYTMVGTGSIVLLVSLLTNYPLGIIKTLPFPVHGYIETVGAAALLVSPWLLGYSAVDAARNVALIVSPVYLVAIALTNYYSYQPIQLYQSSHTT